MELCHEVLAGRLDDKGLPPRVVEPPVEARPQSRLGHISAPAVDRVFATVEDDSAMTFGGLYVGVNPADPSGAPVTPSDVAPMPARKMVETAEEAAALAVRSRSYGPRPAEGRAPALRARGIPCDRGTGRSPAVGAGRSATWRPQTVTSGRDQTGIRAG